VTPTFLWDFHGGRDWNFTAPISNGFDSALQRFDLLLDGQDTVKLACR
jgi:hypothetical protein